MRQIKSLLFVWILMSSPAFAFMNADLKKIYDENGDRVFENLRARLDAAASGDEVPAIVLFKDDAPVAGSYAVRMMRVEARKIKKSFSRIPAVAVELTREDVEQILKDPFVEHIELDARVKAAMSTASVSFGVQSVRKQFGLTGDADGITGNYSTADVVIAVADTGINDRHPDLRGKIVYWKDFVNGRDKPYDDQGHGTHVAGVAAGSGKLRRKLAGVAPQAALVGFKVLDKEGFGTFSQIIEAAEETILKKDQFGIRILNLSLASDGSSSGRDSLSVACNRVVQNGIVVVVAAGNAGPDRRTIGSPSAARNVITVGAGADLGEKGFFLAEFSGRGPTADGRIKPDVWGPGVAIRSPRSRGGYSSVSGTSFASPFVAGVIALMLDANSALTPPEVKNILMVTADRWGPGRRNNEAGAGRIRAYEAVVQAASISTNLDPPPGPRVWFIRGSIEPGQAKSYDISVIDTNFPIAVTAIAYKHPKARIRLELINAAGQLLGAVDTFQRQETLVFKPVLAGIYTVRITAFDAKTTFLLDVSGSLSQ